MSTSVKKTPRVALTEAMLEEPPKKKRRTNAATPPAPAPAPTPEFEGGDCDFQPEDKNPWVTDTYETEDTHSLREFMGVPLPQHQCFGCKHLNPIASLRKPTAAVDKNRIDQLNNNITAAIGATNIDQECINISHQYTQEIQIPANRYLRPGEEPLPDWNPATVKMHVRKHLKNNPLFKHSAIMEELDNVREAAYKASKQVHPVKRGTDGKLMQRVDPVQWKIMKEAIETEHKLTFAPLSSMLDNWRELRTYTQKNGSNFINESDMNVYYHLNLTRKKK